MKTKRIHSVKNRRKFYIKLAAALLLLAGAAFFLKQKKEMMVHEGTNFLQRLLSRETQLDIKIGKISGRLSGVVRFEDVRLEDPALPAGLRLILRAKEVRVGYRLSDLLTKNFSSKVVLTVQDPVLYWNPQVSLRRNRFGFFGWLREWALTQRKHLEVVVKDLKIVPGSGGREFAGIQIGYVNDAFEVRVPVRHWPLGGYDISTEVIARGHFEPGHLNAPDALSGEIFTEGSVVNWSPLPWESRFEFTLTQDKFELRSSDLLGGFGLTASADLKNEGEIELSLETKQYPLSNFAPFLHTGASTALEGRMDLEAHLQGSVAAPNFEAYATFYGGRLALDGRRYQTMNLHLEGVYPTLRLSDSRILLEDGSVMRFADRTLEFKDLFDESIYKKLVSGSDQDTVVMGAWEFTRPTDESQRPEFTMQRSFGKHAQMHVSRFGGPDEQKLDSPETRDTEVGFEYRLKGKDSLKFEMREDERFVGVERKMSF